MSSFYHIVAISFRKICVMHSLSFLINTMIPDVLDFGETDEKCLDDDDDDTDNPNLPVARSGHRIIVTNTDLYSLGGYNPDFRFVENSERTCYPLFKELWKFNFATRQWKQLETAGVMPIELASHTVTRDKHNLIAYGGTGVPFGSASSNDIHVCNLNTLRWRFYRCTGNHPEKKYGHAMILVGQHLYVCGGTTGTVFNLDVHRLDLSTLVWEKLSQEEKITDPEGRYRHEMGFHEDKLFIFGGGTSSIAYRFEKIAIFDVNARTWECVPSFADPKYGYPGPRRCHSCCQLENDVFMCGGMDEVKILPDLWRFSLDTRQWTKMPFDMVLPVYFHAADLAPNGCMYVFGGVTVIDHRRTRQVYRVWLKVPSLQEMAWNAIVSAVPNIGELCIHDLAALGVPADYLDRIL